MKHLHIICKATPTIFNEAIRAISREFKDAGWRITYDPAFKQDDEREYSKDVNLVIKAQRKYTPDHLPKSAINILFQSEQFSKLRQFDSLPYVEGWDVILDVFSDNLRRMEGKVPAEKIRYLPIGYSDAYRWEGADGRTIPDELCDWDVYFFGAGTKYRRKIWKKIIEPIAPRSRFAISDHNNEKYHNITHSKINVFIDGWGDGYLLPMMHCMQIIANRKWLLVITENTNQLTGPFEKYLHFDMVHPIDATEWISNFLGSGSEKSRHSAADKCYGDIRLRRRFSTYLRLALSGVIDLDE